MKGKEREGEGRKWNDGRREKLANGEGKGGGLGPALTNS